MITDYALALGEEINSRLRPEDVLNAIAFHADKIQQTGTTIKAFCPIHQDSRFRSLLVDAERGAFRCTIKTCDGYTGGSLLELYALSRKLSLVAAAFELVQRLELEMEPEWREQFIESYLNEAGPALGRGDLTEAETLLRELISIIPDLPEARVMLADVQAGMGNLPGATDEYVQVIEQFIASDRLTDAEKLAADALQRFSENEDLLFIRIRIAEAQDKTDLAITWMQEIVEIREAANRHLDNIGLLEQLITKAPDRLDFPVKLAGLYEQQHNVRAASRQYESAARLHLARGEMAAGIELLEKVVQFNTENVRARLELSDLLVENGELDKARDHVFRSVNQQIDQQEFGPAINTINKWLEREPDNIDGHELLARVYLDQERPDEAVKFLEQGADIAAATGDHSRSAELLLRAKFLTPDAAVLRHKLIDQFRVTGEQQRAAFEMVDLAEILFSRNDHDAAVTILQDGISTPVSTQLKLQMVTSLANHEHGELALEHLVTMVESINESTPADEAADLYEALKRLDPSNVDLHIRHVRSLSESSLERAADAAADSISVLIKTGYADKATDLLELIVGQLEDYVPAALRLFELCEQTHRADLAGMVYQASIEGLAEQDAEAGLKTARRMVVLDPSHPSAASDTAFLLASLGRTKEAAEQYAHVASILRDSGDYENALQFAREATALNPGSISALAIQALLGREILPEKEVNALAEELLAAGRQSADPAAATTAYLTYAEIHPENEDVLQEAVQALGTVSANEGAAQVQSLQAMRMSAAGDWEAATVVLQKAVENAPESAPIHEQLGEACRICGKRDDAAIAFATASQIYARLGDTENGIRCMESAQQAQPQSPEAWQVLFSAAESTELLQVAGVAAKRLTNHYTSMAQAPATVRWAREWVRLRPDEPQAHEAMGTALALIDQHDNAATSLIKAAVLYQNAGLQAESLDTLESVIVHSQLDADARTTLEAITDGQAAGSALHTRASGMLGMSLVQSGELDRARAIALSLPPVESAARLWTLIATSESDGTKATDAYLNAAQAFHASGDDKQAIAQLESAMRLGHPSLEVHSLMAKLLTSAGRHDEALPHQLKELGSLAEAGNQSLETHVAELRKVFKSNLDARLEIAKVLLTSGRRDDALQDLEAAAESAIATNDAAALVKICGLDEELTRRSVILTRARADSLMGMENAEQALEWVSTSGRQLLSAGNVTEALEMAERWISLATNDPEAYRLQAAALAAAGKPGESFHPRLQAARLLADSGKLSEADRETEAVLADAPDLEPALRLKADFQAAAGDNVGAGKTLADIASRLRSEGKESAALEAFRSSLFFDPLNTDSLWNQAELIRSLEGPAAARGQYRKWAEVRRETVSREQWIQDLRQLLPIIPDSAGLLRDLSNALLEAGQPVEAEIYLVSLANLLESEGDFAGAAHALETATGHQSVPDPAQLLAIGELYKKANQPSAAQDYLRQAGVAFKNGGHNESAVDAFESLLKLAGDSALPEDYALAAAAYAAYGDTDSASKLMDDALQCLAQQSSNETRKQALLDQAVQIAPLNINYVLPHLELMPHSRALTAGLKTARQMTASGHSDDAIRVLSQTIALAPHDMSLRQEIFEPLRQTGDKNRLRQELLSLANDAIAAGDLDAANEALDEAFDLATSGQQYRAIAELNERGRRLEKAAEQYAASAGMFATEGRNEQAIGCIHRAVSANPSAFPADIMAELVYKLGPDVHDIAREQLRAALTARRHKQSQVLALALLDNITAERGIDILKTVYTLGGSTFVVGIARERVNYLLERDDVTGALTIAESLMSIAPDSPDAWYLYARVSRQAGNTADARRAALEAARLYNTAGAVIEEEECYKEALAAEPDNLGVKMTLVEYLVREFRADEAVTLLMQIIAQAEASGDSDVLLDSLNRAVQVAPANTDLREKLATTLENIAPDSAIEHWLELAKALEETEQPEKARRVYGHVLTLHPQNEVALQGLLDYALNRGELETTARYTIALADVKASRKNVGEACRLYQSYLAIDPDNLEMLERLSALSGKSNDAEVFVTTTRALARKFQKLGDNERALRQYELLIVRQPRDTTLLTALLDCAAAAGNSEKGLVYARQLLSVARETEDPERIRLAAATILNYDDGDATAHRDFAEALLSLNRVSQAVTEFMRAAELFEGIGEAAEAFVCYRRTTQISPGTVQAWRRLGELAIDFGDIETATKSLYHVMDLSSENDKRRVPPLLEKILRTLPEDHHLHETALDFYQKAGDADKAVREVLWLSDYAVGAGDSEKAAKVLADAIKWAPENETLRSAHYQMVRQLGRAEELQMRLSKEAEEHERTSRLDEAIRVRRQIVELVPGQPSQHRDLANVLEKAERNDDALEEHLLVIKLLLEKTELEQAREYAEKVVQRFPEKRGYRAKIADVLVESGYPDLAARYYSVEAEAAAAQDDLFYAVELLEKAVAARPAWVEVRELLADALDRAGKPEEAFQARIGLANTLMENGELLQATKALDQLRMARPDSYELREQLAELHGRSGNREQQCGILKELAELYEQSADTSRALQVYSKLAEIDPDDPAVLAHYSEILSQATIPEEDLPEEYSRLADAFARNGDYEAAVQSYEQALGLAPENTSARSRYAAFLVSRGSRQRALAEMRHLGRLYMERNDAAAAVEVLNAALAISPRDADLCLALATAQENAGMHEDARVSYARASAILASTASVKGIDTYRRILSQDPDNTAVRLRLVELLLNGGDKMEAAREVRLLAEVHVNRGELAEAENAYSLIDDCEPPSIDEIREAINRDSYDPSLQYVHYVRLGNCNVKAGNIDAGLDAYRTARSLHDDQSELIQKCIDCVSLIAPEAEAIPDYLLLGEKLLTSGNYRKAREAYEKVRLIDPFNNDAKCGLEATNAAEREKPLDDKNMEDEIVLKASSNVNKRVGLMDLLIACREASMDPTLASDTQSLGDTKT